MYKQSCVRSHAGARRGMRALRSPEPGLFGALDRRRNQTGQRGARRAVYKVCDFVTRRRAP